MSHDRRLSGVLHGLLHMGEADGPLTSKELARAMNTNAVVVRRVFAHLRDMGIVRSEKGHGGGWRITRDLESVTLGDVYAALGAPQLFTIRHKREAPECLMEQAVNAALGDALGEAEALLLANMNSVSLASLADDFHQRLAETGLSEQSLHG